MKKLLCLLVLAAMTVLPMASSAQGGSSCTIVSLPWHCDFNGIADGTTDDSIPCWRKGMSTGYAMMPVVMGEQLYYYAYNMFSNNVMWAIMPHIDEDIDMTGTELSFMYSSSYTSELLVGVIVPGTYVFNSTAVDTLFHVVTSGNGATVNVDIPLTNFEGTGRNIIFRVQAASGSVIAQMSIDNVDLHTLTECPRPTDVTLVGATDTSATVKWSGDATNYVWNLYNSATNTLVATDMVNDTVVTINGLTSGAGYYFRVAALCGPADTSSFTADFNINLYYCQPTITSIDANGITNVTFGTAGQMVNDSSASYPYYIDNSTMVGAVPASIQANVSITYATGYTYGTIIWVDWNRNFIFEGDEVVWYGESSATNPTTLMASFVVPAGQDTGLYRMRIAGADMSFDSHITSADAAAQADPCFASGYAVARDYTLRVLEAPDCMPPADLAVDYLTEEEASLVWDGNATSYSYVLTTGDSTVATGVVNGNAAVISGLSANTSYTFTVRSQCGSEQSVDMSIVFFTGYCTPSSNNVDGDGIVNVSFGYDDEVVDNSDTTAGGVAYYYDYSNLVGGVPAGLNVNLEITYATGYTYGTIVWVDWNHNLVFDRNEVVYAGESLNDDTTTLEAYFMVPATQDTGLYRMRIAGADNAFDYYTGSIQDAASADPCFMANWATAHDYTLHVTEMPGCLPPVNLVLDSADATTLYVSWTPQGQESQWIVSVNDSVNYMVSDSAYAIMNIEPNTQYSVEVRAFCGSDTSMGATGTFATTCTAVSDLPWGESFESYPATMSSDNSSVLNAPCWTVLNNPYDYPYVSNDGSAHHGSNALCINGNGFDLMPIIALPKFDAPLSSLQLTFWLYRSYGSASVEVGVMSDPNDASTFVTVAHCSPDANLVYSQFDVNFGANCSGHIAFRYDGYMYNTIYLDDINVMVAPSCRKPQAVSVRNINSTGATVVVADTSNNMNYHIVLLSGSDTAYNQAVTDTVVSLMDLTPGTFYRVEVSSLCSDSTETTSVFALFNTECEEIATLPYTEDFDSWPFGYEANFNPCWRRGQSDNLPYIDKTGGNQYLSMSNFSYGYSYVVLPVLAENIDITTLELSLDVKSAYSYSGVLLIGLIDSTDYNAYTQIDTMGVWSFNNETFETRYLSFANYQGENRNIIFYTTSTYVHIDNIDLHLIPTCAHVENIVATMDAQGFTLEWEGDALEYEYRLKQAGGDIVATAIVSDTFVVFNNLPIDQDYVFDVRSVCGAGDTGLWMGNVAIHYGYCVPVINNVDGNGITNVTFGTNEIVNNNDGPSARPYYGNYSNLVGDAPAGTQFVVNITYSTNYSYGTIVWIDWNGNMQFEGSEMVAYGTSLQEATSILAAIIDIPVGQDTGLYRMRIMGSDYEFDSYVTSAADAALADACSALNWGVCHDYTLRVTEGDPIVTYHVTLSSADPSMGSVTPNGITEVVMGNNFTALATPASNHLFTGWVNTSGDTLSRENPYTFIVNSDVTLIGTFRYEGVGIESASSDAVSLYPNPANSTVTIKGIEPKAIVTLVDINGHVCGQWSAKEDSMVIDLSSYATGAYFVRIVGEQAVVVRKLIIK